MNKEAALKELEQIRDKYISDIQDLKYKIEALRYKVISIDEILNHHCFLGKLGEII